MEIYLNESISPSSEEFDQVQALIIVTFKEVATEGCYFLENDQVDCCLFPQEGELNFYSNFFSC